MKAVLAKQLANADKTEGDMSEKASFQSTLDNWTALVLARKVSCRKHRYCSHFAVGYIHIQRDGSFCINVL